MSGINNILCGIKTLDIKKLNFFTSGIPIVIFYSVILISLALLLLVTFFKNIWKTSFIRIFSIMAINIALLVFIFTLYLSISKNIKITCK